MISVSTATAQALEAETRQIDLKLFSNGTDLDYEITDVAINKGSCGDFSIGCVYIPFIEVTVDGNVTPPSEIQVKMSAAENGVFSNYYSIGYFVPTIPEKTPQQTKFVAQGRLCKTDSVTLYESEPQDKTLNGMITAIRAKGYTVTIKNGLVIPSGSITLPLIGISVLSALQIIATCSGGFVTEDANGGAVISKFAVGAPALSFDGNRTLEEPTVNGTYELTGIRIKVNDAITYDIGDDIVLEIDNPFMVPDMVSAFTSNTIGLEFSAGSAPISLGDFRLEPWDTVAVDPSTAQTELDEVLFPCLNLELKYDGGLMMTVGAPAALKEEAETFRGGAILGKLQEAYDQAVAANNLAAQASQDAEEALEAVEQIEEDGVDTVYTRIQYAYGTSTTATGSWGYAIPNLTSAYPYLWIRYVTVKRDATTGEETIQGDPYGTTKSTLMSGAYTFMAANYDSKGAADAAIDDLEYSMKYGLTTINGGCLTTGTVRADIINLTYAMYTGSHSTLASNNVGVYVGSDGISYVEMEESSWRTRTLITANGRYPILATGWLQPFDVSEFHANLAVEAWNETALAVIYENGQVWARNINFGEIHGAFDMTCEEYVRSTYAYSKTSTSAANARIATSDSTAIGRGSIIRYSSSSKRWKRNIEAINDSRIDPHKLYELPVVQFIYKNGYLIGNDDRIGALIPGFIAEDMAEFYPIACDYDDKKQPEDWNAKMLLPPMLKLLQEQHDEIERLKEVIYG